MVAVRLYLLMLMLMLACAHRPEPIIAYHDISESIREKNYVKSTQSDNNVYLPFSEKITVLILSSPKSFYKEIMHGLDLFQKHHKGNFKIKIWRKNNNYARLVHLISTQKIHGIITDLPRKQLKNNLMPSCQEYNVPILHLSKREKNDPFFLRSIYPDFQQLIKRAVEEGVARDYRDIAVFSSTQDSATAEYFRRYAKQRRINVRVAHYQKNDFNSMNHATKRIFQVEEEEFDTEDGRKSVYQQMQKYDAVFLPDNFKVLAYFNKIFQYYNLEKIPVIGLHRWRLPQQEGKYQLKKERQNGYFVDFIGDYKNLPTGMNKAPNSLAAIRSIDVQLLGYRGAELMNSMIDSIREVVKSTKNSRKAKWNKILAHRFLNIKLKLWKAYIVKLQEKEKEQIF